MAEQELEITEMILVLSTAYEARLDEAVAKLKGAGVEVYEVDRENQVVEGAADSVKLGQIKQLDCVSYLRVVMTYTAEYPPRDSRRRH